MNGKLEALSNIVERQSERINDLELLVQILRTEVEVLTARLNTTEVVLNNHSHPWQPEPRYGG